MQNTVVNVVTKCPDYKVYFIFMFVLIWMLILNIVIKLNNFSFFLFLFKNILGMMSALACRMESINCYWSSLQLWWWDFSRSTYFHHMIRPSIFVYIHTEGYHQPGLYKDRRYCILRYHMVWLRCDKKQKFIRKNKIKKTKTKQNTHTNKMTNWGLS